MKTRVGIITAAALTAVTLTAPLALAANTRADAFMRKAIAGNLAEIQLGQLAQQKGATEGVRRFGMVLVHDHSAANQQAMTAASSMGVSAPSAPSPKEQAEYQHLASLSGGRFDRAFVQAMVKDHEKDIAMYQREAKAADSPAADYARHTLADLRKHLRIAEGLERHPRG